MPDPIPAAERPTCATCPYWGPAVRYPRECRRRAKPWPQMRANEWCGDHPDFEAWLAAKNIHTSSQIERRVYHKSLEHEAYRHARFDDRHGSIGSSFEFDGHHWSYRYTSFDDAGDYDLIWRPRPDADQIKGGGRG